VIGQALVEAFADEREPHLGTHFPEADIIMESFDILVV